MPVYDINGNQLDRIDEISILFVGNSMTQDGIAYLPYLLRQYYPEVRFRFYMWYIASLDLAQQYTAFTNGTACDIFSIAENTGTWTNQSSSVTMSSVLQDYQFDIVCLQEYFNHKTEYTDADLVGFNNCRDYISANYSGGNSLEFISLIHAPKRENTDFYNDLIMDGNALIIRKTISEDAIPTGIAVYRALSTSLDSLGDSGHLSPDGIHTQEGLPCLLQTYAAALWLFDRLGVNKSIYGCPLRMTTAIYNAINVPGPNLGSGVITGTDAQNLLAQEVAIQAYKECRRFVIDNISAKVITTQAFREPLMEIFDHVSFADESGQEHIDALYNALYGIQPEPGPQPVPGIMLNDGTKTFSDGTVVTVSNNHVTVVLGSTPSNMDRFINLSNLSNNSNDITNTNNLNESTGRFVTINANETLTYTAQNASADNTTWASSDVEDAYEISTNIRGTNNISILPSMLLYPANSTPRKTKKTSATGQLTATGTTIGTNVILYITRRYPAGTKIEFDILIEKE